MTKVELGRAKVATKHFNKGQKLWLVFCSGNMAALVKGRFRGRGRYVEAWIKWKGHDDWPDFKAIEVDDDFAKRHSLHVAR